MRSAISISLLTATLLLSTACGGPRKACRKAERMVARAAWKCPAIARLDTIRDTVLVNIPGLYATDAEPFAHIERDSLHAVLDQLTDALNYERELYAMDMPRRLAPVVATTLARARRTLCQFRPIHVFDGPLELHIFPTGDSIHYHYHLQPRQVVRHVETPVQRIVPCPPQQGRVASWYRPGFWVLATLLFLILLFAAMVLYASKHINEG